MTTGMRAIATRLAGCLAVLAGLVSGTEAAEIKVLSAGAMKAIVTELAEGFRHETGHTVRNSSRDRTQRPGRPG